MKKSGKNKYLPHRGDIVWLDFNPRTGREQAGHRPAIVISPLSIDSPTSRKVIN
ncbi:MAG: type II toxin-antitoxin system PemK/MazF family toxin [Oscillatoria sp. PMC 1068.18]|nr:type II toxin-antitoxin system PemK/MazF family toxin [Oscillatoria sp. PMC 1076.18]MEC4989465.1 type II toxin-antitoxin system PemK/MazF family toxin [Oscillatoria sp. PMC 1068.18]